MNATEHHESFQQFLDQQQYSKRGVKRYEWIFGKTFLSTGGLETTKKFLSTLHLKPGEEVLDVGCGVGGHDFYMAETYSVNVLGIDLSVNMMSLALEHLSQRPHLANKVRLDVCDITQANYKENSFHVIYSRDTLLHIRDKEQLFGNFMRWLKPGGRILFSDYSRAGKDPSQEFKRYVAQRGYHLLTTEEYHQLLVDTGFVGIKAEDETEEFLKALQKELNKLRNQKETFLKEFSEEDYRYLEEGWTSKIRRVADGDQTWTVCYAEKKEK